MKRWQCHWGNYLWWVKSKRALNTRCHPRNDHTDIAFETFCPSIYQGYDGTWIQDTIFIMQKWHLTNKGGGGLVFVWFGFINKLQEEKKSYNFIPKATPNYWVLNVQFILSVYKTLLICQCTRLHQPPSPFTSSPYPPDKCYYLLYMFL